MTSRHQPAFAVRRRRCRAGFTLLEMMMVLVIGSVLMGLAATTFAGVSGRTSSRNAALVFARDLTLARSMAVRGREEVMIRFDETDLLYEVVTESGRELATRRFGVDQDVNLSAIDLDIAGDSLVFSNRGVASLSTALGSASFAAGETTYQVTFNALGASQVGDL